MNFKLIKKIGALAISYPVTYIAIREVGYSRWRRHKASSDAMDVYDGWGLLAPTLVFLVSIALSYALVRSFKLPAWVFCIIPIVGNLAFNYGFAQWANNRELSVMLYIMMPCALLCSLCAFKTLEYDLEADEEEEV